jgi:hypothetical protein
VRLPRSGHARTTIASHRTARKRLLADEPSGVPLADFLRDLAIAWKSMLAYPPGHPSRRESFVRAHRQLARVLATVAPIVLGVSRDGLIHGETKITSTGSQRLAEALHRQRAALLVIDPGVEASELETFLSSLALDRQGEQAPLWDRLAAAGVRGIAVEPIDYQSVVMTEDEREETPAGRSIWETVARELLAGRQLAPHQHEAALAASGSAESLAEWIENLLRQSGGPGGSAASATDLGGEGAAGKGAESGAGGGTGSGGALDGGATDGGAGSGGAVAAGATGGAAAVGGGAASGEGGAMAVAASATGASAPGAGLGAGVAGGGAAFHQTGGSATGAGGVVGGGVGRDAALLTTLGDAVAAQLASLRGASRQGATREVLEVTAKLPTAVRRTLLGASLRALALDEDAADSLRAVAAAQPPAGVLNTLRQLAGERQKLSASAVRLARELAAAAHAAREAAAPADPAAAGAIAALFADRDVDRVGQPPPMPDDRRALVTLPQRRALDPLPDLGTRRDTLDDDAISRQLAVTLLEVIAARLPSEAPEEATLWRIEDLYRGFLIAGQIQQAAAIVEALREQLQLARDAGTGDAELRRCVERLANREAMSALLAAMPQLPSPAAARQLVDVLGPAAVRHLVAALPEETDRSRRHQLLDLLTALGGAVVPHATLLLADSRWFVVRNMVLLLRAVGDQTSLPQVRRCAEHPDLRVRLEAIKSLFAADSQRSADLLAQAINDRDPKVAEAAIGLVGSYNITQGVAPLLALLRRWDPLRLRRGVRVHAMRTLGRLADPAALPHLEPWFRDRLSFKPRAERLAAFEALGGYPETARRPFVERGLRSRDAEVRAVCARVTAAPAQRSLDETHV